MASSHPFDPFASITNLSYFSQGTISPNAQPARLRIAIDKLEHKFFGIVVVHVPSITQSVRYTISIYNLVYNRTRNITADIMCTGEYFII